VGYGGHAYGSSAYGSSAAPSGGPDGGEATVAGVGATSAAATVTAGSSTTGVGATSATGAALGHYPVEVLSDDPLIYWRLGESSGTTAADDSGNSRDGTYVNTPTLGVAGALAGDADTAVLLDHAAIEHVEIADAAWMDVANVSVEFWFKATDTAADGSVTLATRGGVPGQSGDPSWYAGLQSNGRAEFEVYNASGFPESAVSTAAYDDSEWHHFVGTHDGTTIRLYIDGAEVDTTAWAHNVASGDIPITVGRRNSGTYTVEQSVDEFAVYGAALSSTRVLAHYLAGVGSATGTAGSAGAGSTTAVATLVATASAAGVGTVAAAPSGLTTGAAAAAGEGSVTADASLIIAGTASAAGVGAVTALSGGLGSDVAGEGAVTAVVTLVAGAAATGVGAVTVAGESTANITAWTADASQGTGGVCEWSIVVEVDVVTDPTAELGWYPIRTNRVTWPAITVDGNGRPVEA
jgi:hypothetical protein